MTERFVLVTGGSGEIGAAIVQALAAAGHTVAFTFHRGEERARALQHLAEPIACDLTDGADVVGLAEQLARRPVFGLVHVAGTACDRLVAAIDETAARKAMDLNFWSYVILCRHLVRPMSRAKAGRMIAITSVAASRGSRGNAIYSATKAALEGFNRSLATEYANKGITVNAVAPGFVQTRMIADMPSLQERVGGMVPARRCGTPAEVSGAVEYLMSDQARYVTGAVLSVDGGLRASIGEGVR